MKDLIDQRNERERISKSIIKHWNVNYVSKQTKAGEDEDSAGSQAEGAEPQLSADLYNENDWKLQENEMDDVTQEQIDKILHEKSEKIKRLFAQNKGGEDPNNEEGPK